MDMSNLKYEKLITETAKTLRCFIEQYKKDKCCCCNKNNKIDLTEDEVKLINTYEELNIDNNNTQKDFNIAILQYIKQLSNKSDIKTDVKIIAGKGIKIDYDESDNSYTISTTGESDITITPKIKSLNIQSFK